MVGGGMHLERRSSIPQIRFLSPFSNISSMLILTYSQIPWSV
jgi:hypothetical protein